MNKQDAIGYLEDLLTTCDCIRFHLGKYDEAIKIAISALEKQIKKSLLEEQGITHRCSYCENANYLTNEDEEENSYCGNCGQAIDWRNEDEYARDYKTT